MMKVIMNTTNMLKRLLLAGSVCLCLTLQTAYGEDDWRTEFDATCAQSNDAMALSVSELKNLIETCTRLEKIIETKDETVRKVFLKRLQLCKNLYVFVLESKLQEQSAK